jgi:uncharacterized transporter YbjL
MEVSSFISLSLFGLFIVAIGIIVASGIMQQFRDDGRLGNGTIIFTMIMVSVVSIVMTICVHHAYYRTYVPTIQDYIDGNVETVIESETMFKFKK